jgi:cyclopropane fatty-acyl-phospholipid synthase-like methyltransferase
VDFFGLVNISEQFMTVINPSTPEKIVRAGRVMGLKEGMRVIDFGCGFGEALALWAEQFGISGVGIDIREYACGRARQRLAPFGDRFEIACMDA